MIPKYLNAVSTPMMSELRVHVCAGCSRYTRCIRVYVTYVQDDTCRYTREYIRECILSRSISYAVRSQKVLVAKPDLASERYTYMFPCFTSFQHCSLRLLSPFPASSGLRLLVTGNPKRAAGAHTGAKRRLCTARPLRVEISFPSRSNKYFSSETKPVCRSSSLSVSLRNNIGIVVGTT